MPVENALKEVWIIQELTLEKLFSGIYLYFLIQYTLSMSSGYTSYAILRNKKVSKKWKLSQMLFFQVDKRG